MTVRLPAWLQSGSYSAEVDRSIPTGLLMPNSTLGARGGVRRWSGDEFLVGPTATATMQVVVKAGMAWISGVFSSLQGTYAVVNDNDVTLAVANAPTTGARIDLIILELLDSTYSGVSNAAQLRVVTGTVSAAPVAPVVGGSYIVLAQVRVAANVSQIASAAITDVRQYATANGGILPVKDSTERLALTGIPVGSTVLEITTRRVYSRTATDWDYVYGGTPPTVVITPSNGWANWAAGANNTWEELRVTKLNNIAIVTGLITNNFSFSAISEMFVLPVGYRPERRKLVRMQGSYINYAPQVLISPDGTVTATPANDGFTHPSNQWWCVDLQILLNNNTVG